MEPKKPESELPASEQTPVPENGEPQSQHLSTQRDSRARSLQGGGPRTVRGKRKSSQNSFKHGFFHK